MNIFLTTEIFLKEKKKTLKNHKNVYLLTHLKGKGTTFGRWSQFWQPAGQETVFQEWPYGI